MGAPDIVDANLAAFERGVPGITAAFNGRAWLDSWVDDPWVKGSYAGFLPGQYTKYWGYLGRKQEASTSPGSTPRPTARAISTAASRAATASPTRCCTPSHKHLSVV